MKKFILLLALSSMVTASANAEIVIRCAYTKSVPLCEIITKSQAKSGDKILVVSGPINQLKAPERKVAQQFLLNNGYAGSFDQLKQAPR